MSYLEPRLCLPFKAGGLLLFFNLKGCGRVDQRFSVKYCNELLLFAALMNAVRLAKEKSPSVSTEASGRSETPATARPPVLSVAVNWARPLRCPGSPGGGRQGGPAATALF